MRNLLGQPVARDGAILGCSRCPCNERGARKIKGLERIGDQKVFIWAMVPGAEEERQGLELVGDSGKLLWGTLKHLGITREMCAVQNVCRCRTVDEHGRNRDPDKRELQCCSIYNDSALERNRGSAAVHVILGDVAGEQLLGRAFRKDKPVFWHEPWNAYVVLNWHPSYIVRKGGDKAGWDYEVWARRFRAVRAILDASGRFGFVNKQDYQTVEGIDDFKRMRRSIEAEQKAGRRVSVDIEDGHVGGRHAMLMCGFGTGRYRKPGDWGSWKGTCWSVVLDHPLADPKQAALLRPLVRGLIEDASIKKSLHNGPYDKKQLWDLIRARLAGYDYDTMYGTWLRHSFLRSMTLEDLQGLFLPEFGDYKTVVDPWSGNFADAPIEELALRNCGDCDVTQRLEQLHAPEVNAALVKVYCHAGITLDKMEGRGPIMDSVEHRKALDIVPKMIEQLEGELRASCGNHDFKVNSQPQVAWFIYDFLNLPETDAGRSTSKETLELLMDKTGNRLLDKINKCRALKSILSNGLGGYAKCAELYDGELRTRWALCGAVTGRLRSSGDGTGKDAKINLMNINNSPLVQNLLVSDRNWRRAMED